MSGLPKVLDVQNLSKCYALGGLEQFHTTFREMLMGIMTSPFKRYKKLSGQVDEKELSLKLFHSQPGEAIAFNYNLLHGGAISAGTLTRVSLEFTVFVPQ